MFAIVALLKAALEPDDVVLGGGNVANLIDLPLVAGPATMPTRFSADSGYGKKPINPRPLPPAVPTHQVRAGENRCQESGEEGI